MRTVKLLVFLEFNCWKYNILDTNIEILPIEHSEQVSLSSAHMGPVSPTGVHRKVIDWVIRVEL